jgi:tetratricopeptide (TPR) repeat protein
MKKRSEEDHSMTNRPFKPLLLDLLRESQSSQNAFFAQLPADELAAAGTPDFWAAKDHVAHMSFYRRRMATRLQAVLDQRPQPEQIDFEQQNPVIFLEQRDRSWPDILSESDEVYAQLIGVSEQMAEDDLTIVDRFDWVPKGMPLYILYMGNSYDHAQNHLAQYLLDRHDLERAIETFEAWARRVTDSPLPDTLRGYTYYNLACFYATHALVEKAVPALRQAFELYPDSREFAETDPDLDSLRPIDF